MRRSSGFERLGTCSEIEIRRWRTPNVLPRVRNRQREKLSNVSCEPKTQCYTVFNVRTCTTCKTYYRRLKTCFSIEVSARSARLKFEREERSRWSLRGSRENAALGRRKWTNACVRAQRRSQPNKTPSTATPTRYYGFIVAEVVVLPYRNTDCRSMCVSFKP